MSNEGCPCSAYSLFIKIKSKSPEAAMGSAIWKCSVPAPRAPDEDVLMLSPDRSHVLLLICEPDACPAD